MTRVFIDGDACPVKAEVMQVAARHGLKVFLVSNRWLLMPVADHVEKVVVAEGADKADDWIVEHAQTHDLVITSDIPLAARALEKDALALGPTGKPFTKSSIGQALALRELNAHLRETGVISGHNASFTKKDKSAFLRAMEEVLQRIKRAKA